MEPWRWEGREGECRNRFDENPRKLLSRQTHVCSITSLKIKRHAESGEHLGLPETSVIFLTFVVAGKRASSERIPSKNGKLRRLRSGSPDCSVPALGLVKGPAFDDLWKAARPCVSLGRGPPPR